MRLHLYAGEREREERRGDRPLALGDARRLRRLRGQKQACHERARGGGGRCDENDA